MRKLKLPRIAVFAAVLAAPSFAGDFKQAVVILPGAPSIPHKKAAQMLVEEIEKRTQLRLKLSTAATAGAPAIYLKVAPGGKPESFTLTSTPASITVTGADDRGVVFGTGYLLRQFRMARQKLELDTDLKVSTAPKYLVRGQQLGYRPKTNAYDAWSVPMWDQYIRELAIFGNNTI